MSRASPWSHGGCHLLLILDNFEQIVEEAGLEVAKILKACPKIRELVTSRVALHVYGEHEYALPALSNPPLEAERNPETLMQFEDVQLFVARTRQHQPQFKITDENAGVVFDICTALDGIPLALELAAATLRQMSLMDMASMLRGLSGENWIRQIGTPSRDLPERQRTLENVVDWSYVLLTDEQKIFFRQLGVFSNWFDLETAAAVCMEAHPIAHLILNALTNHSLLVHEILQGKSHWRMLELIHEYAVSGLDEVQRARVERRRAEYFSHKLRTLSGQDVPRSERDSFYQINLGNLLAALNWAIKEKQTELGFQRVLFLDEAWSFRGYLKEGLELVTGS